MPHLLNLDQQTMFRVNALLLLVFAVAFAFSALGNKDRRYWIYLVESNVVFAIAFVIFSREIHGTRDALLLPNMLLVIGLGLRWQAIQAFFGHRSSPAWFILLSGVTVLAFLFSDVLGNGLVFGLINALIAAQIVAIIVALAREREPLLSRWGLVFAYGAIAVSSSLRVVQGWVLDRGMDNLLPSDIFLDLNLIAAAVHISASGAFSLSIAYERSVARLRDIALRDPLTGLYNRWSIETLSEVTQPQRARKDAALVLLDIDHFKSVNDGYGHAAGDAVIRHCAELIRRTFRDYNLIARIGGEEFIILLPGKDLGQARDLAEKLRQTIESEPISFQGNTIRVTVSAGISHGAADPLSFPRLLEKADMCLYQAKKNGRNRVETRWRSALDAELRGSAMPLPRLKANAQEGRGWMAGSDLAANARNVHR